VNVASRGTVSVALFVSGVLSIPAVIAADCHHADDNDTSLAATSTVAGRFAHPTLGATPTAAAPPGLSAPAASSGAALGDEARSAAGLAALPPSRVVGRSATGAATATTTAITQARIRGFAGVAPGATVSGQVQIRAIVSGTLNAITYTLNGSVLISYDSLWQPFLFAPDGMGLDTTKLPNGVYTLTAMPRDSAAVPASITFRIVNLGGSILASSFGSGAGLSYYIR
jgi:hypothetical protein